MNQHQILEGWYQMTQHHRWVLNKMQNKEEIVNKSVFTFKNLTVSTRLFQHFGVFGKTHFKLLQYISSLISIHIFLSPLILRQISSFLPFSHIYLKFPHFSILSPFSLSLVNILSIYSCYIYLKFHLPFSYNYCFSTILKFLI